MKKEHKKKITDAMAKVLEGFDWNITYKICTGKCSKKIFNLEDKFCSRCGLPLHYSTRPDTVSDELYKAFEAANKAKYEIDHYE